MTELPQEQRDLDQKIVDEIFAILPEEWTAFQVVIEPRRDLDGGGQIVTVRHPETEGADVEASDDLRAAIGDLVAWFASVERRWDVLTYAGHVDQSGMWRLKIKAPLP
ncbi:MAG: hypothetical protein OEL76_04200 [Siculibacillus sp.]|nr:hypothetical protein [Siculibacillus sp.]